MLKFGGQMVNNTVHILLNQIVKDQKSDIIEMSP